MDTLKKERERRGVLSAENKKDTEKYERNEGKLQATRQQYMDVHKSLMTQLTNLWQQRVRKRWQLSSMASSPSHSMIPSQV